jgi:hypothetical protein
MATATLARVEKSGRPLARKPVALGLFLIFALLPLFAAISGKGYLLSA